VTIARTRGLDLAGRFHLPVLLPLCAVAFCACAEPPPADRVRVSGQIEATDIQISPLVGGRLIELALAEGDRIEQGALVARLDTADAELGLARSRAERDQAVAQLRLLQAAPRAEDLRQAEAQLAAAEAELAAGKAELTSAQQDVDRFQALVASNSIARKQRDDAVARRNVARERVEAAEARVRAARESPARLRAGARREELDVARTRIAAAEVQIATWEKAVADATVVSPLTGIVTERVADPGEIVPPRAPLVTVTDLAAVWANVYVDEPAVPRIRIGQKATLFTDAGGSGIEGTVSYISERAEFTPRNVQTADDRSKLVYRVKISVANPDGVLKAGMPVEAEIPFVQ
jgi:HlyD family secretion protein